MSTVHPLLTLLLLLLFLTHPLSLTSIGEPKVKDTDSDLISPDPLTGHIGRRSSYFSAALDHLGLGTTQSRVSPSRLPQ